MCRSLVQAVTREASRWEKRESQATFQDSTKYDLAAFLRLPRLISFYNAQRKIVPKERALNRNVSWEAESLKEEIYEGGSKSLQLDRSLSVVIATPNLVCMFQGPYYEYQ